MNNKTDKYDELISKVNLLSEEYLQVIVLFLESEETNYYVPELSDLPDNVIVLLDEIKFMKEKYKSLLEQLKALEVERLFEIYLEALTGDKDAKDNLPKELSKAIHNLSYQTEFYLANRELERVLSELED